jgi:AcrR family transcriptional regulator
MPKVTEEHRAARREQIVLAAMKCVAAEGFHKTTMAHVIAESGLSAGAVYGYFRSKEELIAAIADRAVGLISGVMGDLRERDPLPDPAAVLEAFAATVEHQAETAQVDITRVAVAAWAEAVRDPAVLARVADKLRTIRGALTELVRAQQAAGHVDPAADPAHVAQAFFGLMPGFILQRLLIGDVTPQTYAAGLTALRYPRP